MPEWSRRDVLRALGAGVVAPTLAGCGGRATARRTRSLGYVSRPMADVRVQLRELVSELGRRFDDASGTARITRIGGAGADGNERGAQSDTISAAVFSVRSGKRVIEQSTTDMTRDGLAAAAKRLVAAAPASHLGTRAMSFGTARDVTTPIAVDPRGQPVQSWLTLVDQLHERARAFGGSRTVYRGAYLTIEDDERVHVAAGFDIKQRMVRARSGVLFVAWTGSSATADEATRSGVLGLEAVSIGNQQLRGAAERALALITARSASDSSSVLVLDPSVSALLAMRCVGPALEADRWLSGESSASAFLGKRGADALGSHNVTLVDNPLGAAYGSYHHDDEGHAATAAHLIDRGRLTGPVTDRATAAALGMARTANGRRTSPLDGVAPRCSNIGFAPGAATRDELLSSVHRGLLIEGAIAARVDLRRWRYTIRCARAREIVNGRLSGRLYGNLSLRGDVPTLLQSVRGATAKTERFPSRDPEAFGWPGLPRSMGGPFLLTRGEVSRG